MGQVFLRRNAANAIECVKAPPMVGPTWTRVRFTLGSDYLPTLVQGTGLPLLPLSMLYSLFAHTCPMSDDTGL